VIVAPSAKTLDLEESDVKDFCQFRVIEFGAFKSTVRARAAGIRHTAAPLVAFAEDHSHPDPRWAEALIEAHRQPWAAVGPVLLNGSPKSLVSWANVFLAFSRYMETARAGVIDDLPGRNSCYKRQVLVDYGDNLETMLEMETILHRDLRSRGYQLYLEPAAKTCHHNYIRLTHFMKEQFWVGRVFAGILARNWSIPKRLLYTGAGPTVIPLLRLYRVLRAGCQQGKPHHLLLRALPAVVMGLLAGSAGETLGYALGVGNASDRVGVLEFHKNEGLRSE
jgi:hypothetical protein